MPRKAKDKIDENDIIDEKKNGVKKSSTTKSSTSKKVSSKNTTENELAKKASAAKKATKKVAKKASEKASEKSTTEASATKRTATKASVAKKSVEKKSTAKKAATKASAAKKSTEKISSSKKATTTTSATKKPSSKITAEKEDVSKDEEKSTKKSATAKKTTVPKTTAKKAVTKSKSSNSISKESNEKKTTAKKTSSKKSTSSNSSASATEKKTTRKRTVKKVAEPIEAPLIQIAEYYDLPYKYGNTTVRLLAQTPNTLFVYWEVSDSDIKNFKELYGDDFFTKTKPILIVHNLTLNKSYEVEINDFANCWYLNTEDSDCKFDIELGRKFIEPLTDSDTDSIKTDYLYIATSNNLQSPNDHILFEKLKEFVVFRNVSTDNVIKKNIKSFKFLRDIYKFYKDMYDDEILNNPSSNFKF